MDIFEWLEKELNLVESNSVEFIYDDMDSQSGRCLPLLYESFDVNKQAHWADRGSMFDFYLSTGGGRLLDFGPGDGWPSLIVAPFVKEVVGVDASARRVEVCAENAQRLGITNAEYVHCAAGSRLPFANCSFDGVMAASSVDQTPDPKATLAEIFRVLRPGGRLRIFYEALERYRDGHERDIWLAELDHHSSRLILYDRDIDGERVGQYGLTLDRPCSEVARVMGFSDGQLAVESVTVPVLKKLTRMIRDARVCRLSHPSGNTLAGWLSDVGFRSVLPTHSGAPFATALFDRVPAAERPDDIEALDAFLRPLIDVVVKMAAPLDSDPMITAVK